MGGAIVTNAQKEAAEVDKESAEYFEFTVLQAEYERRKMIIASAEEEGVTASVIPTEDQYFFKRMVGICASAVLEKDKQIEECKCPAVIIHKYLTMEANDRKTFSQAILESATARELQVAKKAALAAKVQDYSQSFGGTAADTKNEKEAAAILRGGAGGGANEEEENAALYPLLIPPTIDHSYDLLQLRRFGKWGKVMGGKGCYLYLHLLTKEVVSNRRDDFDDTENSENAEGGKNEEIEMVDPANGLQTVELADLQIVVDKIVKESKKTPLIIDRSATQAVRAFYTYKGLLEV